jgi:UDP-glucose 4-epimerase
MNLNPDFWRGKTVSITGGASFIASHTIERLLEFDDIRIFVYDDLSSGKKENVPKDDRVFYTYGADFRDYMDAYNATRFADIVLDFSSVHGGRGFVGTNHEVAISDNLIINTNVLKAAAQNGVKNIGFASSGCVYDIRKQMDEKERFKIPESWDNHDASMYPDGMYGLTKAVHERVLRAYHNDGLINAAICRFFTVFGRRMKENHFILASIAKSFIKQEPFEVWGTGEEVRNFTPVQNTVEGFLLAVEKSNGEIYNIGLEERITINNALDAIWEIMEWRPKEIIYQPDKPVGIRNRVSDCTKARTELGWEPKVSFMDGLRDTIQWYTETHDPEQVKRELEEKLTSR